MPARRVVLEALNVPSDESAVLAPPRRRRVHILLRIARLLLDALHALAPIPLPLGAAFLERRVERSHVAEGVNVDAVADALEEASHEDVGRDGAMMHKQVEDA